MRRARIFLVDALNPALTIALALHVSLGYILTLLRPVAFEHWLALFWLASILALCGAAWLAFRAAGGDSNGAFDGRGLLPLLPLLILLPAVLAEFAHPSMQITHHGDVHLGFIHQLQYGVTPIENVFAAGYPPAYHWLYHAWLLPIAGITGFNPATVSSLVNVAAMLSSFIWLGKSLLLLGLGDSRGIRLGFLILLVYLSVNITSPLSLLAHIIGGSYTPFSYKIMLLPGASVHLHSTLAKVMNFQSVTLGIMLFCAALHSCLKLVKHGPELRALVLISACGIGAMAVREIAALYIVFALLGGVALQLAHDWIRGGGGAVGARDLWRNLTRKVTSRVLALWLLISLLLSLPLVQYNFDIVGGYSVGRPFGLSAANIKMIIAALLLYLPLLAVAGVWALKDPLRERTFLLYTAGIALGMTVILTLPDHNQYKGVYFLAIPVALLGIDALAKASALGGGWRRLSDALMHFLFILAIAQVAYITGNFLNKIDRYGGEGQRFVGPHIETSDDVFGRQNAYLWIRDHTARDALVILPLVYSQRSNLYHERLLYVRLLQTHFTASVFDYYGRVAFLAALYDPASDAAEYRRLLDRLRAELPGRPVYAVVTDEEAKSDVMAARGAELVYRDGAGGGNVYWLNPEDGA